MKKIFVKSAIVSLFASMLLLNFTGCKNDAPAPEFNLADQLPIAMHLTDATETTDGDIPVLIVKDDKDPDGNTVKMNYAVFCLIENIKITKSGSVLSIKSAEPTAQEIAPTTLASVTGTYDTKTKQMSLEFTMTNTETNVTTKQSAISKNVETIPVSHFVGSTFTYGDYTLKFNSATSVTLNGTDYILQFEGYDSYYLKHTSNEPTTPDTRYIKLKNDYTIIYNNEFYDFDLKKLTTEIYPIDNFVNVELSGTTVKMPRITYTYKFVPTNTANPTSGNFIVTSTPVETNPKTSTIKGTYTFTRTGINKYSCTFTITENGTTKKLNLETRSNTNIVIDGTSLAIKTSK